MTEKSHPDTRSDSGFFEIPQIRGLESLRRRTALYYNGMISEDGVLAVYDYLRTHRGIGKLDLVLSTSGGDLMAARKLSLLLRDFVEDLVILVPQRALSAGTLLCLSADEIRLGQLSELSPIDPNISAAYENVSPDSPGFISAEDVRLFPKMAEDWFGVINDSDSLQVLALVAQRIFPTALTSFYRSSILTKSIALELLRFQLSNEPQERLNEIVESLTEKFYSHEYLLNYNDAKSLGLAVSRFDDDEEEILWQLHQSIKARLALNVNAASEGILGVVAANDFSAVQTFNWKTSLNDADNDPVAKDRGENEEHSVFPTIEWKTQRKHGGKI